MRSKEKWPAMRYGPDGQSKVFKAAEEVPEGWADHPTKVGKVPVQNGADDAVRARYRQVVAADPGRKQNKTLEKEIEQAVRRRADAFYDEFETTREDLAQMLSERDHTVPDDEWSLIDLAERELLEDE